MSNVTIKDGTGQCFSAKVDDTNRILSRAVAIKQLDEEAKKGNAYTLSSLFLTLTTSNESAVLWIKNNESNDIEIDEFIFNAEAAVGASANAYEIEICRNPTVMVGGSGVDVSQSNNNFGSSKTLDITSEVGQEGATLTGGTTHEVIAAKTEDDEKITSNIILPKSSSIGVKITPPSDTTSLKVAVDIITHIVTHQ